MKFAIPAVALLLLLGTTASTYAMQEKGQEEHPQEAKPAQKEARPAQQHTQQQSKTPQRQPVQKEAKPAQQQRAQQQAKPAARQQTRTARPAQQQHAQPARTQRPPTRPAARPASANRGRPMHGRIPDTRYRSSFGSGHRFHIRQSDYQHRRFQYGGYTFGFIDPWPVGWSYSDDVYVEYVDGGYYMYDPVHPGVRISISIQ